MLTDPRTAICDPKVVSRFVEARNMTEAEFQVCSFALRLTMMTFLWAPHVFRS